MILDCQPPIRFFNDVNRPSGKARSCKTLSKGSPLRGTTQIPSMALIKKTLGILGNFDVFMAHKQNACGDDPSGNDMHTAQENSCLQGRNRQVKRAAEGEG